MNTPHDNEPAPSRRPRWSLATMLWLTAWFGGVVATVQSLQVNALLTIPLWLAAIGSIVARDRITGMVYGYVIGILAFLAFVILSGIVVAIYGVLGEFRM